MSSTAVHESTLPTGGFFELGLSPATVKELTKRGVTAPFPIQAAAIPDALSGKDILGQGRTGSGKTLCFGLPLLHQLSSGATSPKRPRGIVLVPTRELAVQIADALEPYARVQRLDVKVVCGGTSMPKQIMALKNGVDVLIATPGRLRDLVERRACVLDAVEVAVLDEADQMADMGFLPEMQELLDQMPKTGQRMLFSATLDRGVDDLAREYLTKPARHSVDTSTGVVVDMVHHSIHAQPRDKDKLAAIIANKHERAIVFVRTQLGADRVAENLRDYGTNARALHGGMPQEARTRTLAELREGKIQVLVATDVAARGIDVNGIDLVLNVDPAGNATDYLHRAGRTARAGRSGVVVTLVLPHQRRTASRLFADAGVQINEHETRGVFDHDLAALTGIASQSGIGTAFAHIAVQQAEREVLALTQELERAQRKVEACRTAAERMATEPERRPRHTEDVRSRSDRGDRAGRPRHAKRGHEQSRERGTERRHRADGRPRRDEAPASRSRRDDAPGGRSTGEARRPTRSGAKHKHSHADRKGKTFGGNRANHRHSSAK